MGYTELAYWHLATIAAAFLMSSYILLARKGTPRQSRWAEYTCWSPGHLPCSLDAGYITGCLVDLDDDT